MICMSTTQPDRGRVIGIGGLFFKSDNHTGLRSWYADKLGIQHGSHGMMFPWRHPEQPDVDRFTIWSIFPAASDYFGPSQARFMINYIVDDLDAILAKLAANGVRIDPKRDDLDYGRFAWIYDPDGNKIELWQPAA